MSSKIRIATWERDGRDQHIRYLVEVRSDLPGFSQPRPPPGAPPPPASVPICGPGPASATTRSTLTAADSLLPPPGAPQGRNARHSTGGLIKRNSTGNIGDRLTPKSLSHVLHSNNLNGIGKNIGPGINTLVRHRYSAFVELKQCLGVDFPLPNKTYFSVSSRKELLERSKALESFLQEMVNKFSIERIPILLNFLGISSYPEDIYDTALHLKESNLVDQYPNIDALLETAMETQVQLEHSLQQQHFQQQHRLSSSQQSNVNSSSSAENHSSSSSSQPSSESVQVSDDDDDDDRDDSVAVL